MDDIIYLTTEDIIEAHKEGFETFGGGTYGVEESCVEKRTVEPQTEFFGEEQYPGIFLKAAVYFYRLAISHCFADGNKRAAVIATDLFLKFNGYKFKASQRDLFEVCYTVADHQTRPNLEEIEFWIQHNTVPFDLGELSDFM